MWVWGCGWVTYPQEAPALRSVHLRIAADRRHDYACPDLQNNPIAGPGSRRAAAGQLELILEPLEVLELGVVLGLPCCMTSETIDFLRDRRGGIS